MFKSSDLAGHNINPMCDFQRPPKNASQESFSKVHSDKRRSRCPTRNQQKLYTTVLIISENSTYPKHKLVLLSSMKCWLPTTPLHFVFPFFNFASTVRRHGKNIVNAHSVMSRSIMWYRVAPEIAQGLGCQKTLHDKKCLE
ncbi:hypothetical protein GHT06_012824 [Daphnia sinensis]|uniref:Uncharacterized protein n=1 Tax=Daphnia sinensis TaxID=1820382 RepID=A0AAD5KZ16_9CRUS|nr:hypothetical protein GHT06_012824 [Daphnia sinensis]